MAGVGDLDQRGRHPLQLQRGIELFGLTDRGAIVLAADDDQGRGLDLGHLAERRARPVSGRIFPRQRPQPIRAEEGRRVGGERHAGPVDDGLLRGGGAKAGGLADDPRGQDAAARSAGDEQIVGVGAALGNRGVDRGHEVVIVAVGIGLLDPVGEALAVTGGAARVGEEDGVAGGGIKLIVGREMRAITGVGAAVDFKDHRHAGARLVARREHQPGGDIAAIGGANRKRLEAAEVLGRQGQIVEPGELAGCAAAVADRDIRRAIGAIGGEGDRAGPGEAERTPRIRPVEPAPGERVGQRGDAPVEPDPRYRDRAVLLIAGDNRAAVGGPGELIDAAVERGRDLTRAAAVHVHNVEVALLVAFQVIVVADVGNQPAIGRGDRRAVGALAAG